ncbi:unnamed protein product, partial [marine sediment metagenome]
THDERLRTHDKNMEGYDPVKHKLQRIYGSLEGWQEFHVLPNIEGLEYVNVLWRYVDKDTGFMTKTLHIGGEEHLVEAKEPDLIPDSAERIIERERGKAYGDFDLNMRVLTRTIEAMVAQAIQQEVTLPDNFGALVMCQAKILRECFKHKEDNGLDHFNYLAQARKMGEEQK